MGNDPPAALLLGWEFAQCCGLAAIAGALLLFIVPVRPRALPPSRTFSIRAHEIVGWIVLGAAGTHVAVLLIVDSRTVEHVKATAPVYEWAGIVALALLIALTAPSTQRLRRRLWTSHRNFQAFHVTSSCAFVAIATLHVLATDRYVHGRLRWAAFSAVAVVSLLALLRGRPSPAGSLRGFVANRVFGRHSVLVTGTVAGTAVALTALMAPGAGRVLREPMLRRGQSLPIAFPHEKHRAVNCIRCHHNYTDGRGIDTCIGCHRGARRDLKVGAEARFHDFCLGCHRDPPPDARHHGPTTGCVTCHVPPRDAGTQASSALARAD